MINFGDTEFSADPAATKENLREFREKMRFFIQMVDFAYGIRSKTKSELLKARGKMGDDLMGRFAQQMEDCAEDCSNIAVLFREAEHCLLVVLASNDRRVG
jgi:hypothetical protein